MSKAREAMQYALEALVWEAGSEPALYALQTLRAVEALRAALDALAEKQEPVAWGQIGMMNGRGYLRLNYDRTPYPPPPSIVRNLNLVPLFAAPPAREPLTDEQIAYCIYEARMETGTFKRDGTMSFRIARAVERAHGIGADHD